MSVACRFVNKLCNKELGWVSELRLSAKFSSLRKLVSWKCTTRLCLFKWSLRQNGFKQTSQKCRVLVSVCWSICRLKLLYRTLWHKRHLLALLPKLLSSMQFSNRCDTCSSENNIHIFNKGKQYKVMNKKKKKKEEEMPVFSQIYFGFNEITQLIKQISWN